ncbi:DUF5916 domain-containing protein [candidate division KSB1 bacterium]
MRFRKSAKTNTPVLTAVFTIFILLFPSVTSTLFAQEGGNSNRINSLEREYTAKKVSGGPKIDGRLDDDAWKTAHFDDSFLQREPVEGAAPTERTEFAILYDNDNLYIGVRCFDSNPGAIRATEMRRDQPIDDDDCIEIILDTFDDKRSAFYFATNALGVRIDGKMNDEGKNINNNWDGVWYCRSLIDDDGWNVEIAIPWQTLRFKEGSNVIWNANFVRQIRRNNEYIHWSLVSQDYGPNGKFIMSEAGRINGFESLKMGGNYEFIPYVTGGIENDRITDFDTKSLTDTGLDLKWNMTSNLTADFTYNTDFAQVEADQEMVNLERFSLYFPEKRGFFLEGAENFNFGHPTHRGFSEIHLFHSRRIGIENGYQVPVIGGARVQGKADKYSIGFLSLQTENTNLADNESTYIPNTNYSAIRIRRDILSRSTVGVMLLNKYNTNRTNRSYGVDSYFPLTDHFSITAEAAGTYTSQEGIEISNSENYAGHFELKYDSDLWDFSGSYLDIAKDFSADMGYIRRKDLRRSQYLIQYSPRPERFKAIRQVEFNFHGYYMTDHSNRMIDRHIDGKLAVIFENGAHFEFSTETNYEYLYSEWDIRPGITVQQGGHSMLEYEFIYRTSRKDAVYGEIAWKTSDYYNSGRFNSIISKFEFKAINRLRGSIDYEYNSVDLPNGIFHTNTVGTRLSYSFNPDLYLKAYIQLLDDKLLLDNLNRVTSNVLFHYIYKPGSDFYIVFNEIRMIGANNEVIDNRVLMTKFTYFFRK